MATLTPFQVANYLTTTFWTDSGWQPRKWDVAPGGVLDVLIDPIGRAETATTKLAMDAWTYVSGVNLRQTNSTGAAEIKITDKDPGAFSWATVNWKDRMTWSEVNVSAQWAARYGNSATSYYMQTMVHELGHSLGLGHAGLYNGSATWAKDRGFDNDTWQMSIMSYFPADEGRPVRGSFAFAVTPMPADIIAIHNLYGKPSGVGAGDTIYGWNTNAPGIWGTIGRAMQAGTLKVPVMMTIFDQGGIDTIDMSGDHNNQIARMGTHQFSDVMGLRSVLGIAYDTVIENWKAGGGNDRISGNSAANGLWGGSGNDTINGLAGHDRIYGGNGNDQLFGGDGNDRLDGGRGRDILNGGAGNDLLNGNEDDDQINGDAGNDRLFGGAGNDTLTGGAGDDQLTGDDGNDSLSGADGNDTLDGGAGNDSLRGGAGHDLLRGGADKDRLYGDAGNDTVAGDAGNDWLSGGAGNDALNGGKGNDRLYGGTGNDRLYGGSGDDSLFGNSGADRMWGNAGADVFVFTAATDSSMAAPDRIMDFERGQDRIDFDAFSLALIGTRGFTGRGPELRQQVIDGDLNLLADLNGDRIADMRVVVEGSGILGADSFIL